MSTTQKPQVTRADACPSEDSLIAFVSAGERAPGRDRVLAHVDRCGICRQLVAELARQVAAQGAAGPRTPGARTLDVGDRVVDRYEIRRFIARGGMGEVYEAVDHLLDEPVALKTLACTALDDDRAAFRFRGEARLARRVTHPNVCRILEFGVQVRQPAGAEAESIPFLTMEFLSGETLAQRVVRQGAFSPAEALPVIRQVLSGLRAIHRAGIVHRDLKSENVFLVPDGRGGERAVVMDFGLARALDGSVVTTWPRTSSLAGTIDCMAPEQIEGAPVGAAADIYAVGVLMFELLTGRRPFANVQPLQRLVQPAPAPSSLVPDLDRRWDAVIARCLERRPGDRYATLDDLVAALPAPTEARRSAHARGGREVLPWLVGLAVVAVVAVVAWSLALGR